MYITENEYSLITGKPAAAATIERINISSKLLDSRIGNYPILESGFKIRVPEWAVIIKGQYQKLHKSKIEACKLWICAMISFLIDNNDKPPTQENNIKLGRFSVGTNKSSTNGLIKIPEEMFFQDSILISSGIINRRC